MLGLAGESCYPAPRQSEQQTLYGMQECRRLLCKLTGKDFGYNLQRWHQFLISSEPFREQYMFPYAWSAVEPRIHELIHSNERQRLAAILESQEEQGGSGAAAGPETTA
jgi:hypothetical protein